MIRIILFLTAFLLIPDLLIWFCYLRPAVFSWRTLVLLLPTVAVFSLLLLYCTCLPQAWVLQLAFSVFLCIAVPKIAFVVIGCPGRLLFASRAVQHGFSCVALAVAVMLVAVQIYGTVAGWKRLDVVSHKVKVEGMPAGFRGYRVVQLSDLHLGTYAGDTRFVEQLVAKVNSLQPDLIVFTGDLINILPDEIAPFREVLATLRAHDGVISILGNHDYCTYVPGVTPQEQAALHGQVIAAQRDMGWHLLRNEHVMVVHGGDTLYVVGVENVGRPPFPERGRLDRALCGIPSGACTLLLSHDPWHWRHGVTGRTRVPLTLSGHTHAMQLKIGSFSPASWFMPEWGGLYREGSQQLFVSTGVGGTIPYRLGAWPQIEVFEF